MSAGFRELFKGVCYTFIYIFKCVRVFFKELDRKSVV